MTLRKLPVKMMLVSHKHIQSMAVLVIIVFSFAWCQEDERRAVAEHQLLHDRGQTMQSLKRLMWLSNTMEGLHTAQTRTAELESDPMDCSAQATLQAQSQLKGRARATTRGALLQMLWCAAHKPHLSSLPDNVK